MSYTSTSEICRDIVETLKASGFVNDNLPNTSVAPNRPVFRVGVSNIAPKQDALDNTDKTTVLVSLQVVYIYPVGGGDPQKAEYDIAVDVERILDSLAHSTLLDAGCALTFTGCRIRNVRPAYNRADINLDATLNI